MGRSLKVHGKDVGFKIFGNVRVPNKFVQWLTRKPFSMFLDFNVGEEIPFETRVTNSDIQGRGAIVRSRTISFGEYSTQTFNDFPTGSISLGGSETSAEGFLNETQHYAFTAGFIQTFNLPSSSSYDYQVLAPATASNSDRFALTFLYTYNLGSTYDETLNLTASHSFYDFST